MWPLNSIEKRLRHISEAVMTLQRKVVNIESIESWTNHKRSKVDQIELNQGVMAERLRIIENALEHIQIDAANVKAFKAVDARNKTTAKRKRTRRTKK